MVPEDHTPTRFIRPVELRIFHTYPAVSLNLSKEVKDQIRLILRDTLRALVDLEQNPRAFAMISDHDFNILCRRVSIEVEFRKNNVYEVYNFYSNIEDILEMGAKKQILDLRYSRLLNEPGQ